MQNPSGMTARLGQSLEQRRSNQRASQPRRCLREKQIAFRQLMPNPSARETLVTGNKRRPSGARRGHTSRPTRDPGSRSAPNATRAAAARATAESARNP